MQKVTIHISKDLLAAAQEYTHKGITETMREGLEMLARAKAYDQLLKLRGKIDLKHDYKSLREDR